MDAVSSTGSPKSNEQESWRYCEVCQNIKPFTSEKTWRQHQKKSEKHQKKIGCPVEKNFTCGKCGKAFLGAWERNRHEVHQCPRDVATTATAPTTPAKRQLQSFDWVRNQRPRTRDSVSESTQATENATCNGSRNSLTSPSSDDLPTDILNIAPSSDIQGSFPMPETIRHRETVEGETGERFTTPSMSQKCDSGEDVEMPNIETVAPVLLTSAPNNQDVADDSSTDPTVSSTEPAFSRRSLFRFLDRPSVGRVGAGRLLPDFKRKKLCHLCQTPIGTDKEAILKHVKEHCEEYKNQKNHLCEECHLGFVHSVDLKHHLQSVAERNHCGFNFKHDTPCTGHHPPASPIDGTHYSNHNRAEIAYVLQDWEQAQLHLLMATLDLLPDGYDLDKHRWSIGHARLRSGSTPTPPSSVHPKLSTPNNVDYNVKTPAKSIEQRLVRRRTQDDRVHMKKRRRSALDDEAQTWARFRGSDTNKRRRHCEGENSVWA